MNLKKGHLMSKSFSSVACGTQDVSHGESDSKEKRGRTCIATCKVERLSRFNSYVFRDELES